ncbi:LOW QUALITY PROTEIN: hypothetical protein PoB_007247000 [Plakobranchus ocellatus]|uniref:Uncharacterized protein n=1 Tax=Plakobranchus ocellatus TaxID=259542 RepID=A0AAV4DPT2_9GAST|nr:LOW QUALITY PROTEIN: hypothetical protein PoB_007247000 [Plakobranchus ocellatus]
MATMEEIVKQADLLGYRGEKKEEYLKQEFKLLAERQAREKKEEAERQAREKKEEAERQERQGKVGVGEDETRCGDEAVTGKN